MYVKNTGQLDTKNQEKKAAIDLVTHPLNLEGFPNRTFHKHWFHLLVTFKKGKLVVTHAAVAVKIVSP